jgi:hypothetical protein
LYGNAAMRRWQGARCCNKPFLILWKAYCSNVLHKLNQTERE